MISHSYRDYAKVHQVQTAISIPPTLILEDLQDLPDLAVKEKRPQVALMQLAQDLRAFLGKTQVDLDQALEVIKGRIMPAFEIPDLGTAQVLKAYLEDKEVLDLFVISKDPIVLKVFTTDEDQVRNMVGLRPVLDLTDFQAENLIDYVYKANASGSRIVLLSSNLLDKEALAYIQSRAVSVWLKTEGGDQAFYDALLKGPYGLITEDFQTAIEALESFDDPVDAVLLRNPVLVAHRGCHEALPFDLPEYGFTGGTVLPENSTSGAQAAIGISAEGVECDIQMTTDGQIVVHHDDTTARMCLEDIHIENSTYAEVAQAHFKIRPEEGIPLLEDYLRATAHSGIIHVLEIKSVKEDMVPSLKEILEKTGMMDRVILISFQWDQLDRVRRLMPQLSVGYLNAYTPPAMLAEEAYAYLSDLLDPLHAFYNCYDPCQSHAQVVFNTHRGILVHPWTVNDHRIFQLEYLRGYHAISSDTPTQATDLLVGVEVLKKTYTAEEFQSIGDQVLAVYRNGAKIRPDQIHIKLLKADPSTGKALYTVGVDCILPAIQKTYRIYSPAIEVTL